MGTEKDPNTLCCKGQAVHQNQTRAGTGAKYGPVDECALDLDLVNEARDSGEDMASAEERLSVSHEVGD